MSVKKTRKLFCLSNRQQCLLTLFLFASPLSSSFANFLETHFTTPPPLNNTLAQETVAKQLGWEETDTNQCGGYYLDQPFNLPIDADKENAVEVTSNQTLFARNWTSILEGVTLNRAGQQITANKAYLYRDSVTGKLSTLDMIGNVRLREPNTLIIGKKGRYIFASKTKSLADLFYRTTLTFKQTKTPKVTKMEMSHERKITAVTAWGKADAFSQSVPRVYELSRSSFSTCPPTSPAWQLKTSHLVLNKNTGRGYATNARIYVRSIPVFYFPYITFSIDGQRKSGFLWPTVGANGKFGPYLLTPFYLNLAPNYDTTITPGLLSKRGLNLSDDFRYLNHLGTGNFHFSVMPHDRLFAEFQKNYKNNPPPPPPGQSPSVTLAELNRLFNDTPTRKSFSWHDDSRFNAHWSSHIDFNYAGDDYYLQDFGSNLNEVTLNQLLQEGDLYYKGQNWSFTGRVQAYQALHPVNDTAIQNQYRRFPQLIFNADYPDQKFGLDYFMNNEVSHFDILNTPGTTANLPVGNRLHVQPGLSLPLYWPFFYINPRIQFALTDYYLSETAPTNSPSAIHRDVPIFDIASGLSLTRDTHIFGHAFAQTLEPQIYYTYIPFRNQQTIPLFDTSVNTLTYDQLFNYNRFSGLDRIGDANQVGVGVSTRLIDQESGLEKMRFGVGEIIYFANRYVTLCTNPLVCTDNPFNHSNYQQLSPISAVFSYHVNPSWSFTANPVIWNTVSKQLDNVTVGLHYQPDDTRIANIGYSFARNGDILSGITTNNSQNNLKLTDISFAWPAFADVSVVGRWSQDFNMNRLQNLLYGVQYDSCCWAVRLVMGRAFTGINPNNNNKPKYNSEFYIQFSLKGLGDIGNRSPNTLLASSISGYKTQFGQEI